MKLNKIKEVLDSKGISQTWLAKQLGKSFSTVNCYARNSNFDLCKFPKADEEILSPAELLADYFKKRRVLIMKLIRNWRRYSVSWG